MLKNEDIDEEISKKTKHAEKFKSEEQEKELLKLTEELSLAEKDSQESLNRYNEISAKASTPYLSRLKKAEKEGGEVLEILKKEIEEIEKAKNLLPSFREEKNAKSKSVTSKKAEWKKLHDKVAKYDKAMEEALELTKKKKSEEELYEDAKKAVQEYLQIFSSERFFIELQFHGLPREEKAMPVLAKLAGEMHLKCICSNDCHTLTNSPEELKKRALKRTILLEQ